jgi:hypothetical protein
MRDSIKVSDYKKYFTTPESMTAIKAALMTAGDLFTSITTDGKGNCTSVSLIDKDGKFVRSIWESGKLSLEKQHTRH